MKKILMLLALAGVTSVASAQQTTITGYEVIHKTRQISSDH